MKLTRRNLIKALFATPVAAAILPKSAEAVVIIQQELDGKPSLPEGKGEWICSGFVSNVEAPEPGRCGAVLRRGKRCRRLVGQRAYCHIHTPTTVRPRVV